MILRRFYLILFSKERSCQKLKFGGLSMKGYSRLPRRDIAGADFAKTDEYCK